MCGYIHVDADDQSRELVFAELGFPLADFTQAPGKPPEPALQPPPIDSDTPEGQASRKKLLRAWVELSAWLAIYGKNSQSTKLRVLPL